MITAALLITLALAAVGPADAARTVAGLKALSSQAATSQAPLGFTARHLQMVAGPAANATDKPSAIRVTLTIVVGPNDTLLTFLPGKDKYNSYVYGPLT
ncbi:hypothetical protein HaLaN_28345, partial [Haematococcus lacustris]